MSGFRATLTSRQCNLQTAPCMSKFSNWMFNLWVLFYSRKNPGISIFNYKLHNTIAWLSVCFHFEHGNDKNLKNRKLKGFHFDM